MTQQYPQPGQPAGYHAHQAPQPLRNKPRRWPWMLGILAALLVGIGIGSASSGGNNTASSATVESPASTVTVQAAPAEAPPAAVPAPAAAAPAGPVTTFGNGTYQVGTDVAPGRYRSPAPTAGAARLCYWDITDNDGKILDQGVANEGPSIANLKAGRNFKSSGCEDWSKIG